MDIENLSRRERRHYRKFVDNKVVYTDGNDVDIKNNSKIINSDVLDNDLEGKSLLDLNEKSKETNIDKKKVINNILGKLNEMITPDVDEISDVIYSQLKNENVHVEKKIIMNAVKNSKHYRSSKKQSSKSKSNTKYDSKNLESVVKDVYNQIEKEHIKKDNKAKKEEVVESKSSKKNITKDKDTKKPSKANSSKNKSTKPTSKKQPKTDFKDLLEDDSNDDSDLDSDDDLGLKF